MAVAADLHRDSLILYTIFIDRAENGECIFSDELRLFFCVVTSIAYNVQNCNSFLRKTLSKHRNIHEMLLTFKNLSDTINLGMYGHIKTTLIILINK